MGTTKSRNSVHGALRRDSEVNGKLVFLIFFHQPVMYVVDVAPLADLSLTARDRRRLISRSLYMVIC